MSDITRSDKQSGWYGIGATASRSAEMALVWLNVDSQYLSQELANQIADVVSTRNHAKAIVERLVE